MLAGNSFLTITTQTAAKWHRKMCPDVKKYVVIAIQQNATTTEKQLREMATIVSPSFLICMTAKSLSFCEMDLF